MATRKSDVYFGCLAVGVCLFCLMLIHAFHAAWEKTPSVNARKALVEQYGLTDLCLFTDAQYTRNPATADLATAFRDHPVSLEHFPSGSIVPPPRRFLNPEP